ncbi:MAG: hydrolase [Coxiellaceae bacterium]|nr:hydrolase [Coxiellaceae bacterium]
MSKPILKQDFKSFIISKWNRNPHVQTCFPAVFSPHAKSKIRWEEFNLPDGDFIDCCWAGGVQGPLLIMLHGIEGSVSSHYIQSSIDDFVAQGWRVLVMHFRGCSGRINRLRRAYHSGDTADFDYILRTLVKRYPHTQMMAIGFSLGANILLKYVAEKNYPSQFVAAAAISVPFDLGMTSDYMHPLYQLRLTTSLSRKLVQKMKAGHQFAITESEMKDIKNLREFDDKITADIYNFNDANDYYQQCSCKPLLPGIELPTLILHALDDPFIPKECVPARDEISRSSVLEITPFGGHVGFVSGKPWSPIFWMPHRVISFFREQLMAHHETL